jgi:drug/metabolite transporter (DMT)-like permease
LDGTALLILEKPVLRDDDLPAVARSRQHLEAVLMMAGAMLLLPIMDVAGKYLAVREGVAPGTTALFRFGLQALIAGTLLLMFRGLAGLKPKNWPANLLRGLLIAWASGLFLISVKYVPVADAISIFFVEPFIVTALSALLLKERVGLPRWSAIAVGFAGSLLVIQPNFREFGLVSLLPLATALLFSFYLLLNRVLAAQDNSMVMQFSAGIGGFVAIAVVVLTGDTMGVEDLSWTMPRTSLAVWLLLLTGLISVFGHLIIVTALRQAPASLLAPLQYFEIVSASIVGYLVFDEFPTAFKWLGIAIIIGSGLFIIWREQRAARQRKI